MFRFVSFTELCPDVGVCNHQSLSYMTVTRLLECMPHSKRLCCSLNIKAGSDTSLARFTSYGI